MSELQNKEFILPGGLGSVFINGVLHDITEKREEVICDGKVGFSSITITIRPDSKFAQNFLAEDADFEVIEPKQLEDKKEGLFYCQDWWSFGQYCTHQCDYCKNNSHKQLLNSEQTDAECDASKDASSNVDG